MSEKYESHSHYDKWAYRPNILHTSTKMQLTATDTSLIIAKYVLKQLCPSNVIYRPHMQMRSLVEIQENYLSTCDSFELSAINIMTRGTRIHTSHIVICP